MLTTCAGPTGVVTLQGLTCQNMRRHCAGISFSMLSKLQQLQPNRDSRAPRVPREPRAPRAPHIRHGRNARNARHAHHRIRRKLLSIFPNVSQGRVAEPRLAWRALAKRGTARRGRHARHALQEDLEQRLWCLHGARSRRLTWVTFAQAIRPPMEPWAERKRVRTTERCPQPVASPRHPKRRGRSSRAQRASPEQASGWASGGVRRAAWAAST